jgi:hypothetical protein
MQQQKLQGSGAETIHISKFLETNDSAFRFRKRKICAVNYSTCLSLETPFIKQMTQGNTLIPSFSTRKGTFSTKTRKNLVLKYFGARA